MPKLGARPIGQITAAEILSVLRPVETRGNLETAKRLRATVGAIFRYTIATARAESDPTAALKGARSRRRASIGRRLPILSRWAPSYAPLTPSTASLKPWLPSKYFRWSFPGPANCGWRNGANLIWKSGVWTIPATRTKMRREHQVPLPRQALAILADLKEITGDGRLVFPGNKINRTPDKRKYAERFNAAHGFQTGRSSSAWLSRHGFDLAQ